MPLTAAQRRRREEAHHHVLKPTIMWVYKVTYSCVNFEDADEHWGCNYSKTYSKQWIRDRVLGKPIPTGRDWRHDAEA